MLSVRLLAACALALFAGSGVALAVAERGATPSTATIYVTHGGNPDDNIAVKVNSADARCLRARIVKMRKVRAGADALVATKTTKDDGWARKRFEVPDGLYYARVQRREAAFGTCGPADTGTTTVP
jgi:hypothetical protein